MKSFYLQVAHTLADLLGVCILSLPHVLLLKDNSTIPFPFYQKKTLPVGVSAAAKKNAGLKVETSSYSRVHHFSMF